VLVADLSIFGLLREYSKHGGIRSGLVSFPTSTAPVSTGSVRPALDLDRRPKQNIEFHHDSTQGEDWEESPTKEKE
jgi:hypothetical protein